MSDCRLQSWARRTCSRRRVGDRRSPGRGASVRSEREERLDVGKVVRRCSPTGRGTAPAIGSPRAARGSGAAAATARCPRPPTRLLLALRGAPAAAQLGPTRARRALVFNSRSRRGALPGLRRPRPPPLPRARARRARLDAPASGAATSERSGGGGGSSARSFGESNAARSAAAASPPRRRRAAATRGTRAPPCAHTERVLSHAAVGPPPASPSPASATAAASASSRS